MTGSWCWQCGTLSEPCAPGKQLPSRFPYLLSSGKPLTTKTHPSPCDLVKYPEWASPSLSTIRPDASPPNSHSCGINDELSSLSMLTNLDKILVIWLDRFQSLFSLPRCQNFDPLLSFSKPWELKLALEAEHLSPDSPARELAYCRERRFLPNCVVMPPVLQVPLQLVFSSLV